MKKIVALLLIAASTSAFSQVHVQGYTRKDGTYVAPHQRTAPNHTNLDNYSTRGNVNPYTGQAGTKEPDGYGYQQQPTLQPAPIRTIEPLQPLAIPQVQPIQPLAPMRTY